MPPRMPTRPKKEKKPKIPPVKISDVGSMGNEIFTQISSGMNDLIAINGRIYIEVYLEVEDDRLFGPDQERRAKLVVEVALEKK